MFFVIVLRIGKLALFEKSKQKVFSRSNIIVIIGFKKSLKNLCFERVSWGGGARRGGGVNFPHYYSFIIEGH